MAKTKRKLNQEDRNRHVAGMVDILRDEYLSGESYQIATNVWYAMEICEDYLLYHGLMFLPLQEVRYMVLEAISETHARLEAVLGDKYPRRVF